MRGGTGRFLNLPLDSVPFETLGNLLRKGLCENAVKKIVVKFDNLILDRRCNLGCHCVQGLRFSLLLVNHILIPAGLSRQFRSRT